MTRHAFKMKLRKGYEEEYRKRHDALWPELLKELEDAGISDYSIFLDPQTQTLFAFQKLKAYHAEDALGTKEIVKKWWKHMADIMETNPDGSPVATDLTEVFHMD